MVLRFGGLGLVVLGFRVGGFAVWGFRVGGFEGLGFGFRLGSRALGFRDSAERSGRIQLRLMVV